MTYKKTLTSLAIVVIAALMASASVVVALTIITEGAGISHATALKAAKECPNLPHPPPKCGPPLKPAA
jgi:hypothetical protein